ncbi:hypothetical protein JL721_9841 [Aureococcus anophagefferens]|nr:hypothetical protein JL721_9841 [Aureococcus anophagefferens]
MREAPAAGAGRGPGLADGCGERRRRGRLGALRRRDDAASSLAPAGAATAEACEPRRRAPLGRRRLPLRCLGLLGLRVLADRRCPAIVERGDEPRLTYPCGVVGVGGVDVRHGYEFLATLAAAEHASTKQSYLFRGLTPFARAVLPKEFETAQRLGELSKPSTEGDSLGLFRGLEGTSVSSPQPSLELEDAILRTADDALAEARGALEGTTYREDRSVASAPVEGELSLPRAIRATARLNETLATSATSAKAAIEALGGLKARRDAEERKLRVYERRLHKAPPEVVVAHSPTPLVKLNELLDTSVDATFATFETRRVNWSEQLELGRVSPTRGRALPRGRLEAGHRAPYESEYRGSSAYPCPSTGSTRRRASRRRARRAGASTRRARGGRPGPGRGSRSRSPSTRSSSSP